MKIKIMSANTSPDRSPDVSSDSLASINYTNLYPYNNDIFCKDCPIYIEPYTQYTYGLKLFLTV